MTLKDIQQALELKPETRSWILNGSFIVVPHKDHFRLFDLNDLPNDIKVHLRRKDETGNPVEGLPFKHPRSLLQRDIKAYKKIIATMGQLNDWRKVKYKALNDITLSENCPILLDHFKFKNAIIACSQKHLAGWTKETMAQPNEHWYVMALYDPDALATENPKHLRPLIEQFDNCPFNQQTPYRWWLRLTELDKPTLARLIDFANSVFDGDNPTLHLHRGKLAHDKNFYLRLRLHNRSQWRPHRKYVDIIELHREKSRQYIASLIQRKHSLSNFIMNDVPLDDFTLSLPVLNITLVDASLKHCLITDTSWRTVSLHYLNQAQSTFARMDLSNTHYYQSTLTDTSFIKSHLTDSSFEHTALTNVFIIDSILSHTKLNHCQTDQLKFDGCDLDQTDFLALKGDHLQVHHSRLSHCHWHDCTLTSMHWKNVTTTSECIIHDSNLKCFIIEDSNISELHSIHSKISSLVFKGTIIMTRSQHAVFKQYGANFEAAKVIYQPQKNHTPAKNEDSLEKCLMPGDLVATLHHFSTFLKSPHVERHYANNIVELKDGSHPAIDHATGVTLANYLCRKTKSPPSYKILNKLFEKSTPHIDAIKIILALNFNLESTNGRTLARLFGIFSIRSRSTSPHDSGYNSPNSGISHNSSTLSTPSTSHESLPGL